MFLSVRIAFVAIVISSLAGGLVPDAQAQSAEPVVFVVNNVSDEVSSFTMNDDGTLVFVGNYPTSDVPYAATVAPGGEYLAVTHASGANDYEMLQVFHVNADASLTLALDILVPSSPLAARWLNDDLLAVIQTDLGGANYVHVYAFDPDAPSLTLVDSGETGGFSSYIALHPTLPIIYTQQSSSNTIRWFQYDEDGYLTLLGTRPTGSVYPLSLTTTNQGRFLYAAGGISVDGHKVIGCVMDGDGNLTLHEASPFDSPGQSPAHVAVSSDDKFLFVGHGTDATLRSFHIGADGAITPTGFVFDVGFQGTLGDTEIMGDYLFVTDESTVLDGITGIYSFYIKPSGILVPVDDIYITGGVRPEAIVLWSPSLIGDVNGDGVVDVLDLIQLLGAWGACSDCPEDLNDDGVVDVLDLLIVLGNWS